MYLGKIVQDIYKLFDIVHQKNFLGYELVATTYDGKTSCGDVDHFFSLIYTFNALTAHAWYNSEAVKHCGSTVYAITIVVALTTRSGVNTSIHGVREGHSAFSYP